jgi:hypothetical protein
LGPRSAGGGDAEVDGVEFVVVTANVKGGSGDGGGGADEFGGGPRAFKGAIGVDGVEFFVVAADVDNAVGIDGGGARTDLIAEWAVQRRAPLAVAMA